MASTPVRLPAGRCATAATDDLMRIRVHEPAVALTDLTIGIEAGLFALVLGRARRDAGAR